MARYDISTPRSGNVSGIGGIHSFAVSFVVKKSGTVKASDLGGEGRSELFRSHLAPTGW